MTEIDIGFQECSEHMYSLMKEIIKKENMFYLEDAKILIILDTKKRISRKKIVLGRIMKTNDMLRFLSIEPNDLLSGYDYMMLLDMAATMVAGPEYLEKLVRHELRHCTYDDTSENPWGLRAHDIEDFYDEVELNKDDPLWAQILAVKVHGHYVQNAKKKNPQRSLFEDNSAGNT